MTCSCDIRAFPPLRAIPAGLSSLPRQLAGFSEFRAAMLAMTVEPEFQALAGWRGRSREDFGMMLIEMWAYVCDVLAFYDQVRSDEAYLRTAKLDVSLRRLTRLIGYKPRPAVAAAVRLALLVDGTGPLTLPAGTAFRSGSFGGQPPQVFETLADATLHPAANRFAVVPPRATSLRGPLDFLRVDPSGASVKPGRWLLVEFQDAGDRYLRQATRVSRVIGSDGQRQLRVDLDRRIAFGGQRTLASARLWMATRSAAPRRVNLSGLALGQNLSSLFEALQFTALPYWKQLFPHGGSSGPTPWAVTLDGVYRDIRSGDRILISLRGEYRAYTVMASGESDIVVSPGRSYSVNNVPQTTPAIKAPFTTLALLPPINDPSLLTPASTVWHAGDPELSIHYGLVEAGRLMVDAATSLAASDPLLLTGVSGSTPGSLSRFILQAGDGGSAEVKGRLAPPLLTLDDSSGWSPPLALPVAVHANVVEASQGQRVPLEILGSGDAAQANQRFILKKSPLTYLGGTNAGSGSPVQSTLAVSVNGLLWTEVETFYGQDATAAVYTVHQDAEERSVVTFGDGVRGARLPTGVDNVRATYRFGAGAKSPPAGSITQVVRGVKGLKSALNPIAAAGGEDAERADELRLQAPRSALLLGRLISIQDMEAAAAAVPGVSFAAAEWCWDGAMQRPVVAVFYRGPAALQASVLQRLVSLSDPSTPIRVTAAVPVTPTVCISVETDPRADGASVAAAVKAALLAEPDGVLSISHLGIGKPLFRSQLFAAVLDIPGVVRAQILWNGALLESHGKTPGTGRYFEFSAANLTVNGDLHEHG